MLEATGLVVTVAGKRLSRVKLLEVQVSELMGQISSLTKQNTWLRARETMQMQLLSTQEDTLVQLGTILVQTADTQHDSAALTTAMILDLQAQELLEHLKGPGGSSSGCSASSSPSNSSDDQGSKPAAGQPLRRSQRLWATVTPAAVQAMQGISTEELAGRFKTCLMRLALIKQCANPSRLTDSVESAVNALGELLLLSLVAVPEQQLEVQCLNFETMQQETPADGVWAQVVEEMRLTPDQRRKVHLAFECYRTLRASLLQQQQLLAQELRELLGAPADSGAPPAPGSQPAQLLTSSTSAGSPGVLSGANNCAAAAGSPGDAAVDSRSPAGAGPPHTAPPAAGGPEQAAAAAAPGTLPPGSASGSNMRCSPGSDGCRGGDDCEPRKNVCSSSSSSLVPGTIDLNAAVQAEAVLERLDRNTRLQRAASRQLIFFYIDLLTTEQHADAVLAAYPYNVRVPAVLSLISEQEAASLASPGKKAAAGK